MSVLRIILAGGDNVRVFDTRDDAICNVIEPVDYIHIDMQLNYRDMLRVLTAHADRAKDAILLSGQYNDAVTEFLSFATDWTIVMPEAELTLLQRRPDRSVTVIIPTMNCCRYDIFHYTISELMASGDVRQIVVIDNSEHFDLVPQLRHYECPKLVVHVPTKNMGVNRSWNWGVENTHTKYYLLMNDDILCHRDVIAGTIDWMEKHPNWGVATVTHVDCTRDQLTQDVIEEYESNILTRTKPEDCIGHCGAYIFGRKERWKPIPQMFQITNGDDYIVSSQWGSAHGAKFEKWVAPLDGLYLAHDRSMTLRQHRNWIGEHAGLDRLLFSEMGSC